MSRKSAAAAAARIMEPGKAKRVEKERARLMELFIGADPNKLDFIRDAVQQVAWLGITILELQSEIDEKGPVLPFQNGQNQNGLQANPACKTLKDFQTLYNTQFRALLPVVPEGGRRGLDKLTKFRLAAKLGIDIDDVDKLNLSQDDFYCGELDENGLPLDLEDI